ncbi:MAG: hypothetical protein CMO01_10950 [Thalassobius sp.]|nr:hypothetical protein [Thalassovita sp.]
MINSTIDETSNKVLGHSDNIQNGMEVECEFVSNGINYGDENCLEESKSKKLEQNAENWSLLLQIDSNDALNMMWGDSGRIYYWIKNDDLLNRNFDNCWFCLQCY